MILAGLLLLAAAPEAASDTTPDIVVRAVRGRCNIVYAGSQLDGRALDRLVDGWPAGRPLRVLEPRGANRKCLVKVTFQLAERGFTNIQFIEPAPAED